MGGLSSVESSSLHTAHYKINFKVTWCRVLGLIPNAFYLIPCALGGKLIQALLVPPSFLFCL